MYRMQLTVNKLSDYLHPLHGLRFCFLPRNFASIGQLMGLSVAEKRFLIWCPSAILDLLWCHQIFVYRFLSSIFDVIILYRLEELQLFFTLR